MGRRAHNLWSITIVALGLLACNAGRLDGPADDGDDGGSGRDSGNSDGGGPVCRGRQCQVPRCPSGTTTEIIGRLFAGNGSDPVPGAILFVPTADVPELPTTLSCDQCNTLPDAVATATTSFDGSFRLRGVPSGSFPLVARLGRFQRVASLNAVAACVENSVDADPDTGSRGLRLPRRRGELAPLDRVPRIAVVSGDYDQIECVLKRIGIDELDMYNGRAPGTSNPPAIAEQATLFADRSRLFGYDIVVANCTDNQYQSLLSTPAVKQNLEAFVGSGGRLYVTDWAYDFVEQVPEFSPFICFEPQSPPAPPMCTAGPATPMAADSRDYYSGKSTILDAEMARWLAQFPGVIDGSMSVEVDYSFVVVSKVSDAMNGKTKVWVEGAAKGYGTRPQTVTFDYKSCGRVHFSTYNTEPNGNVDDSQRWPNSCKTALSPQERLLEYLFFDVAACVGPPG